MSALSIQIFQVRPRISSTMFLEKRECASGETLPQRWVTTCSWSALLRADLEGVTSNTLNVTPCVFRFTFVISGQLFLLIGTVLPGCTCASIFSRELIVSIDFNFVTGQGPQSIYKLEGAPKAINRPNNRRHA